MEKKSIFYSFVVCLMLTGSLFSADTLYVVTGDGHLLGINGMTTGVHLRGSAGDNTFADKNWTGGIFSTVPGLNVVAVGPGNFDPNNPTVATGRLVVAGSVDAGLLVYDQSLTTLFDARQISSPGNPVTAVDIGDFGTLKGAVIAAHSFNGGSNILVFRQNPGTTSPQFDPFLLFQPNPVTLGSGTVISDLVIGDTDPTRVGNEVMVSSNNFPGLNPAAGTITRAFWDGANPIIELPQQGINNFVSAIAVGDLFPGLNANEIVQFGANETGSNPTFMGDSAQAFTSDGPSSWPFKWFNTGDNDPNAGTGTDGVIADVTSDAGLEAITVGNSRIIIMDGNPATAGSPSLAIIETGQPLTSVVVADVVGNDGVGEIVVGASSGMLLAYEHSTPGDLTSPFVLSATLLLDPQGLGTQYQVTDIASAACQGAAGELTGDCFIDMFDFGKINNNWLADTSAGGCTAPPVGDVTGDCIVNLDDLNLQVTNWLSSGPGVQGLL